MARKSWHQNFKRAPRARRESRVPGEGVFASMAEKRRWNQLQTLQAAGHIKNLQRQTKYDLVLDDGTPIYTKGGRVAKYTADFVYTAIEELAGQRGAFIENEVIEDVKGFHDTGSQFRIAVFEAIWKKKVTFVKA